MKDCSGAAGDDNPLHFDPEVAWTSPHGNLIANGAPTASLMFVLKASHFSKLASVEVAAAKTILEVAGGTAIEVFAEEWSEQ